MEAVHVQPGSKRKHHESSDTTDFCFKRSKRKQKKPIKSLTPEKKISSSSDASGTSVLFSERPAIQFRSVYYIDRGSSAKIYAVKEKETDAQAIALKLGDPSFYLNDSNTQWIQSDIKDEHCICKNCDLHDEASIHQQLKHKNIIQFIDFGHVNINTASGVNYKIPAILMELAGTPLDKKLQDFVNYTRSNFNSDEHSFPLSQRFTILTDVAKGLEYIHDHSILHMDIHPKNILISQNRAKICDFSLSFEYPIKRKLCFDWSASLTNMAPEFFFEPKIVSLKSDLFSMGVTIRMCIAGTARSHSWWTNTATLRSRDKRDISATLPEPDKQAKIFNIFDAITASEMVSRSDDPEYTTSLSKRQIAINVLENIAKPCMQLTPDKRPDIKRVLSLLEQNKRSFLAVVAEKNLA
ncbi:MAG: protein kinase family protein [Endozoicomonadaceae bacterium]|nr:protein kinase family protein [Endozoicomonadaceae bacterium]